jgi:NAD(P)-dependent dehydrogenase (short-subunit alcohol dehydrogenase family)
MVEEVADHYGRLDIMVNCSGLNREEKAGEVTEERFDYVLDVVAPTFVRTEQVAQTLSDALFYNGLAARIPLGRIAEPDEVANAVLFFVSGASDFITGQTLYLDGGMTAAQ